MKLGLSDKVYWILLIGGLSVFLVLDWFWIIPYYEEWGINLFTSALFVLFTIIFLDRLFVIKEKRRMKSLEREVIKRLGDKLYEIVDFSRRQFLSGGALKIDLSQAWFYAFSRREFYDYLQGVNRLHEMKAIVPLGQGRTIDLPQRSKPIEQNLLNSFLDSAQYLEELEMRYSEFLDPRVRISLLSIQAAIKSVGYDMPMMKSEPGMLYDLSLARSFVKIIAEIHKIHTFGIEVYSPPFRLMAVGPRKFVLDT